METHRRTSEGVFSALPSGTVLDRYRIDSVIAAGGFGITYLAHHVTLRKPYALKEHFPRQLAYREAATSSVRPTDPDTFTWALDRFIQEGRTLAQCHHPNVVAVADVFDANGTAYMALAYEEGQSLRHWLDSLGHRPTQAELDALLVPLLAALEYVHEKGLLHRDIAPDNIIIRSNGTPCLIDFGAARQAAAERSQMISAIVKSGYSPQEQYTRSGRAQGPWSDIYALGATLYRAVTGVTPQEATERVVSDDLRPIAELLTDPSQYRRGFLDGIEQSLRMRGADRPQSVAAWRAMLFADAPATLAALPITPRPLTGSPAGPATATPTQAPSGPLTFSQLPSQHTISKSPAESGSFWKSSGARIGLIVAGVAVSTMVMAASYFRFVHPAGDPTSLGETDKSGVTLSENDRRTADVTPPQRPNPPTDRGTASNADDRRQILARVASFSAAAPTQADASDAAFRVILERAAGRGDAMAQAGLGVFYRDGRGGLARNDQEAGRLFRLAADQGNAIAQRSLGNFYGSGRGGLAQNDQEAARLYQLAADQGDAPALNNLGVLHASGRGGFASDDQEAARLYRLAADKGVAVAQANLAYLYQNGRGGLAQDDREAARLYKLAADQGHAVAENNLGVFYQYGRGGLARSDEQAARLFKRSADHGYAVAQNNLGAFYQAGRGGLGKNEQEAARLYKRSADQGYSVAQYNLAVFYQYGHGGLIKNEQEAVHYYKLASDQGYAPAQNSLGVFYELGQGGLTRSEQEAARLYKLAAAQGNSTAENNLGLYYQNGRGGLTKSDEEAARLYKLAADKGYASAQNNLAVLLQAGRGLPKDDNEAARLYRLAADQNNSYAQNNLGFFYQTGRGGLEKSDREAARYYKLSADNGNNVAVANLAFFHEYGRGGLKKDLKEAVRLYRLAADQGNAFAKTSLARLGKSK